MNESAYTRSVNKLLDPEIHAWKINARYAGGVPDCWYSGPKTDLWVEWKLVQKIGKKVTPKLSALQKRWLNRRHDEGRNVSVIIGSPAGGVIITHKQWNEPYVVMDILSKREIANWINDYLT